MATAVATLVNRTRSRTSIIIATVCRILLFAITCTGLGMAFGLFTGIAVQIIRSLVHRGVIDMTIAYRYFGIPLAITAGVAGLVVFSVIESRTARRLLASRRAGPAR